MAYEAFAISQAKMPSPLTVLALQDKTTELDANDEGIYLLCRNKGDPLGGRSLLPIDQLASNEWFEFSVVWHEDNSTNIRLVACTDPVQPVVHSKFQCVKVEDVNKSKTYALGSIRVARPAGSGDESTLLMRISPDIWGRTVTVTWRISLDGQDGNAFSDSEVAVYGLDTVRSAAR